MSNIIPHNKPEFDQQEIQAVQKVLESGFIAMGEKVQELEKRLCQTINQPFCSAVSSGTMALSLALKSLGVTDYDEVIIPSYTCSALYHAVSFCNAIPIFADIEEETCNLSPDSVKQLISPKTKAIIFPHMFGQPGYIQEVQRFGIPVIEDIAQAVGGKINNQSVGSFGEISVISFYATKMLGAGEGGAILTKNPKIYSYINSIREYDESDDLTLKYNAKMTDITAAIALQQLSKLDKFIQKRQKIHKIYQQNLENIKTLPFQNEKFSPNYFRYIISQTNVNDFIKYGENNNIQFSKPVYKPLHLYRQNKILPITEKMWKSQVSIPIFIGLKENDAIEVIKIIQNYE